MSHRISHLTLFVFDHCVVSFNHRSPFYDNIHITAGSGWLWHEQKTCANAS